MGATWKSVNHENLACAYKWDFDFGYEQVAKANCEYPLYEEKKKQINKVESEFITESRQLPAF